MTFNLDNSNLQLQSNHHTFPIMNPLSLSQSIYFPILFRLTLIVLLYFFSFLPSAIIPFFLPPPSLWLSFSLVFSYISYTPILSAYVSYLVIYPRFFHSLTPFMTFFSLFSFGSTLRFLISPSSFFLYFPLY